MEDFNYYLTKLLSFTISFCTGLVLVTYLLGVPQIVTGNEKIVEEYYEKNYLSNVPLDYLFVSAYLLVSYLFIYLLKLEGKSEQIVTVGITTAVLTSFFCLYFKSKSRTSSFFAKWFNTVGYTSALYDVILLVVIFIIYLMLEKKTNN